MLNKVNANVSDCVIFKPRNEKIFLIIYLFYHFILLILYDFFIYLLQR